MATIWEFWPEGRCINVHLARLLSGVQKADLDVLHQRLGDGSHQWKWVFLALSNRGARSILVATLKFIRSSHSVSRRLWFTLRMDQRAFGSILCLLCSDWSLRWLDVCIYTGASKKVVRWRLVKDAASSHQKLGGSRNGRVSREALGQFAPGLARSGRLLQRLFPNVVVYTVGESC